MRFSRKAAISRGVFPPATRICVSVIVAVTPDCHSGQSPF
nr:MAG TPA: hypothetical protein [Caudoviricetes sp.]